MSGSSTHSSSVLLLRLSCWSMLLPLALLLRSLAHARHRPPKQTSALLSARMQELSAVLLRLAAWLRPPPSIRPATVSPWAAGSGLHGELVGGGLRWGPSCSSFTPSPKGTHGLSTGYTLGSCSSVSLGGSTNGTPSTDPSASTMANPPTTPTDGGPGHG